MITSLLLRRSWTEGGVRVCLAAPQLCPAWVCSLTTEYPCNAKIARLPHYEAVARSPVIVCTNAPGWSIRAESQFGPRHRQSMLQDVAKVLSGRWSSVNRAIRPTEALPHPQFNLRSVATSMSNNDEVSLYDDIFRAAGPQRCRLLTRPPCISLPPSSTSHTRAQVRRLLRNRPNRHGRQDAPI